MSFIRNIVAGAALAAFSSDPSTMGPPQERRCGGHKGPLWKRPNPPESGQKINAWDDEREVQRKLRRKRGF